MGNLNSVINEFQSLDDKAFNILANSSLEIIGKIIDKVSDEKIGDITGQVTKRVLESKGGDLLDFLRKPANAYTFEYIKTNIQDLVHFLADLLEPVKYDDEFNELNFSDPKNRHALICLIQRTIISISYLIDTNNRGSNFKMDTKLQSDNNIPLIYSTNRYKIENIIVTDEEWLFINGVAGEYHWLSLNCNRLKHRFHRNIEGIFNKGNGLIWDLVECAGERNENERTQTSELAEDELYKKLKDKLEKAGKEKKKFIVIIAYSQGCLLLKLVLEKIINEIKDERINIIKEIMKNKLRVFTFGNPSTNWHYKNDVNDHLSDYVNHTEHFANYKDYVAKLGVADYSKNRYNEGGNSRIFINYKNAGHMFGTQYSLSIKDYSGRRPSILLEEFLQSKL